MARPLLLAALLCLIHASMGGVIPAREPHTVTDDDSTSSTESNLAWKAQISDPFYSVDDELERWTRDAQHGDHPSDMMKADRSSIKVATLSMIKNRPSHKMDAMPSMAITAGTDADTNLAWKSQISDPFNYFVDDELERWTRAAQHGDDPSDMMKAAGGSDVSTLSMIKNSPSQKMDAMPSIAITAGADADTNLAWKSQISDPFYSVDDELERWTRAAKHGDDPSDMIKVARGKKRTIDGEMVKTLKVDMSHKLNSYIGETPPKDLAMGKSYDGIPEGATNPETIVHTAEMADMRAALEDLKSTMSAIAKKMFPGRRAEAKGPVQPARITPPGSDSSLVGAAHVASTVALDSEPTLDSSAALLRDNESTSKSKLRRGLVADDALVSLNEEKGHSIAKTLPTKKSLAKPGDMLMDDPSMTHDDPTLEKGLPIAVKLSQDAKMSMQSTDVPTEIIESTESPAVDTAFTETPAEGTEYPEAPEEGTVYTETPAVNMESAEAESTTPSVDTTLTETPELATVSAQEDVTTLLPFDSETIIPTTIDIIGLETPEVENAPPIIILVDGDEDPIAVGNIHPKKKPKYSDSHLPALVQILTHLIEELDLKEISMSPPVTEKPAVEKPPVTEAPSVDAKPEDAAVPTPVTVTTPSVIPVLTTSSNTGSDGSSGITIVQLTIPNLTLGDSLSESLVIEVIPFAKNASAMADKKKLRASDIDDDVEDMQEDMPVVQHDVPIVNEETVPMTMVINMVPSDEHEMMVDDAPESEALFFRNVGEKEESDDLTTKEEVAKSSAAHPAPAVRAPSQSLTRPTRQDDAAGTKQAPLTDLVQPDEKHRYVHYPTLFFTDVWQRSPGNAAGYLGFNEGPPAMKDHVDLEEETALKDTADDVFDERRFEFDDLKDNGFLLSAIREVETNVTERPPPSPELKTLVKLRFHLSTDAKKQGLAKFQGFSDALIEELAETNNLTGREQFVVVLKKVLAHNEIRSTRTIDRAEDVLEEVEDADSPLSEALEDIPALQYLNNPVPRNS